MKTIALYHIKGGVGKTASAANLAYLSARDGAKTLLWDLDPQGALTYYFRIKAKLRKPRKAMLKGGSRLSDNIKGTDFENLDLLPSDFSLRNLDLTFDQTKNPKQRLKKALAHLESDFDTVFLDCPPNLTLVSENVFQAADVILVPVIPTTLSARTYAQLRKFLRQKKHQKTKSYLFFSMVEARKIMHRETMTELKEKYPDHLTSAIPYRSDVEKMGIFRKPIFEFAPRSPAALAFEKLYGEIMKRLD